MQEIIRAFSSRPAYQVDEISFMRHIIIRDVLNTSESIIEINKRRGEFLKRFLLEIHSGIRKNKIVGK